jgi:hypothetical protein
MPYLVGVTILQRMDSGMAANTEKDHRTGAVRERIQVMNPVTKQWVKIDTKSGRIVDSKKTPGPYKGVRKSQK